MNSIVGFSLTCNLPTANRQAGDEARQNALRHYTWLTARCVTLGETQAWVWGHGDLGACMHTLSDGSLLISIGSPASRISLPEVGTSILNAAHPADFSIPWDGRSLLLRISADGQCWTLWNDWIGSIPVFHAQVGSGRVASTLEPVTVSAAGYTPDDFFLPGLLSLLINGHYLSDWTLYNGMRIIPPDSCMEWDARGFRATKLWTVKPSQGRWEAGWDDLVDEMYELTKKAITETLRSRSEWVLPLSSGLDSRLIAGVAAEAGANVRAFTWGDKDSTDVNYSRRIAKTLGIPWKHIQLKPEYLVEYTPPWVDHFGSAMPFHGMYQMCFFDALQMISPAPIISGFFGDVISGDGVADLLQLHIPHVASQLSSDWYLHWSVSLLKNALQVPVETALEINRHEIGRMLEEMPGAPHQKMILLETWNRQRLFTSFQTILKDYWRGVATPFLNREYARFCLSLPRAVMDNRQLLTDVFRRYYGRLAVIPGTYANEPLVLTGKYLLMRRAAEKLHPVLHFGPLRGFGNVQLRTDVESLQHMGAKALWPLFESRKELSAWFKIDLLEQDVQTLMQSKSDISPLRRLQAVQVLAWALTQRYSALQ